MAWPGFTGDVSSYSEKCYEYEARCKTSASVALLLVAFSPTTLFITLYFVSSAMFLRKMLQKAILQSACPVGRETDKPLTRPYTWNQSVNVSPGLLPDCNHNDCQSNQRPQGFCPLREMFVSSSVFVLSSNTLKANGLFWSVWRFTIAKYLLDYICIARTADHWMHDNNIFCPTQGGSFSYIIRKILLFPYSEAEDNENSNNPHSFPIDLLRCAVFQLYSH